MTDSRLRVYYGPEEVTALAERAPTIPLRETVTLSVGEVLPLAHIGLYGFSAQTLQKFARLPETNLERAEGLEQLRALWHGIPIEVAVGKFRSVAVDTPEDLERVRKLFSEEVR